MWLILLLVGAIAYAGKRSPYSLHHWPSMPGPRTTAVVLSGSLADGSRGLAAIHAAGGLTMVLDPGNKPRGMQQNAIDYDGSISLIGSPEEIAASINQRYGRRETPCR